LGKLLFLYIPWVKSKVWINSAIHQIMLSIEIGQVISPTPEGLLKFCVDVSFKNTSLHEKSGQMISAPPDQADQAQHTIPQSLKGECTRVVKGIYGKELADFQFDSYRICWFVLS
jgi:sarcosine oxidase / L-pipecolate oxidase